MRPTAINNIAALKKTSAEANCSLNKGTLRTVVLKAQPGAQYQFLCNITKCTTLDCCRDLCPNAFHKALKTVFIQYVMHYMDTSSSQVFILIFFIEVLFIFQNSISTALTLTHLFQNDQLYFLWCSSFVVHLDFDILFLHQLFMS